MKPNMKKKFDFSAEMSEAEAIKATPKNEYLEEEKQFRKNLSYIFIGKLI